MHAQEQKNLGCLSIFSGILSVYQIIFAFLVLQQRGMLGEEPRNIDIQAGLAGLWAIMLLLTTVGLFRAKPFAVRYGSWLIVAFVVYNLLRMTLLIQADYDRNRLAMYILLSMAISIVPLLLGLSKSTRS